MLSKSQKIFQGELNDVKTETIKVLKNFGKKKL